MLIEFTKRLKSRDPAFMEKMEMLRVLNARLWAKMSPKALDELNSQIKDLESSLNEKDTQIRCVSISFSRYEVTFM